MMAMARTHPRELRPLDIVQVSPEQGDFAGALVVITEIRSWGVIGYVQIPGGGQAFIRLGAEHFEDTGGRAVFTEDGHRCDADAAPKAAT